MGLEESLIPIHISRFYYEADLRSNTLNPTLFLEIRHTDTRVKKMRLADIIEAIPCLHDVKNHVNYCLHSVYVEAEIRVDLIEITVPTQLTNNVVLILFTGDMISTYDRQIYMRSVVQYLRQVMNKNDLIVHGPECAGTLGYLYRLENCDLSQYAAHYHDVVDHAVH